jgi:hypothetical protein
MPMKIRKTRAHSVDLCRIEHLLEGRPYGHGFCIRGPLLRLEECVDTRRREQLMQRCG